MSTEEKRSEEPTDAKQLKRNRLQLVAILAIVLVPVIGSTFMFYTGIGMPEQRNNNGLMIEPAIDLREVTLNRNNGSEWDWSDSGKFRLVTLVNGVCDSVCADRIFASRQLHVRLAKRSTSLERVLVQLDGAITSTPSISEGLEQAYPQLQQLQGELAQWQERLAEVAAIESTFNGHQLLLVDRRGYLIMVFNADIHGQAVMDDVNFLIKSTQ